MGQDDVYDYLCKHRSEWFTNKQLSKKLRISLGSATRSTSKLCDKGIILHKPMPGSHNGRLFMVEAENQLLTSIIFLCIIIFSFAFIGYTFGVHLNNNELQAIFVDSVNDNLDDKAVDVVASNCSNLSMDESQIKCVSNFMKNISARSHSAGILTPSELVKNGGVCRDIAVMYAAVFDKLGWGYTFTFPLKEHVFTTVYIDVNCSNDSMVDCAVYCNLDWNTYACYRIYDEKKRSDWTWLKIGLVILVVIIIINQRDVQKLMPPAVIPDAVLNGSSLIVVPSISRGVDLVPGTGGAVAVRDPLTRIMNFHVCKDEAHSLESCDLSELHDDNMIHLYWEVQNGVGCCSTFGCDYGLFRDACLVPMRLFDVYVDGVLLPWDDSSYDYVCDYRTPWNYYVIYGLSLGRHDIMIRQKDCVIVVSEAVMKITLSREGSYYRVEQVRIK